jgi:hypothetical protein
LKTPPSFARKYVKGPVTLPQLSFNECRDIYMAQVIPNVITRGVKSILINKSWKAGEIEIALYSEDGKNKIKSLYKGINSTSTTGFSQFFLIQWDGTDPDQVETYSGNYRIRWTTGTDSREYAVSVIDYNSLKEKSSVKPGFLKVYPNPCIDKAIISWDNPDGESYNLSVYDLRGKLLREIKNITESEFEFRLENMKPGIFILKLGGERSFVGRLVVQ